MTVVTTLAVGRLGCDDTFAMFGWIYVSDTSKCWVGNMDVAFNDGKTLMRDCWNTGEVRI